MTETGTFSVRGGCGYRGDKFVVDGPDGLICGEFDSEAEAQSSRDLWAEKVGRAVRMSWTAPPEDAPDSNCGDYCIKVVGTDYEWHSPGGWHAMEHSMDAAKKIYNIVAKWGAHAVAEILRETGA